MESPKKPDTSDFDRTVFDSVPTVELARELAVRASSMILIYCPKLQNNVSYCSVFGNSYEVKGLLYSWVADIKNGRMILNMLPRTLDGKDEESKG